MSLAQFQIEYRSMLVALGFDLIPASRMAMDAVSEIKMSLVSTIGDRELLSEIASVRRTIGLAAVYGLKAGFNRATTRSQQLMAEAKKRGII